MLPRSAKPVVFSAGPSGGRGVPVRGQSWAGKGRLQGTIKDERASPSRAPPSPCGRAPGQVDPKADGPKTVTTDKNGKWSILGLAGGSWGVLIQKEGYMDSAGAGRGQRVRHRAQPINVTLKVPPKEVVQQAQQAQNSRAPAARPRRRSSSGNALLQAGKYADARAAYEEGMSKLEEKDRAPAAGHLPRHRRLLLQGGQGRPGDRHPQEVAGDRRPTIRRHPEADRQPAGVRRTGRPRRRPTWRSSPRAPRWTPPSVSTWASRRSTRGRRTRR